MNKKAQFMDYVLNWIPKLIILSIVFMAMVFYVNKQMQTKLDVQDVEASLLIDRMVYSKNCFAYVDNSNGAVRPYPGIININEFTTERIDMCVYYGLDREGKSKNIYTSAKLTLTYTEDNQEQIEIIYHNKDWYENWYPLVGIRGPGGTKSYKESNYVLVRKDDELLQGKLEFNVILPNS